MINQPRWLFYLTLLLLLPLSVCDCGKSRIVVRSALFEVPESMRHLLPDFSQGVFQEQLTLAIQENKTFEFDKKNLSGRILKIVVASPIAGEQSESLTLAASLSPGESDQENTMRSFTELTIKDQRIDKSEIFLALKTSLRNLSLLNQGRSTDNRVYLARLQAYLSGEELGAGEVVMAINILGEAKDLEAVTPLNQLLLATRELTVANACLMALGEIGDERSMAPIIEFTERKPPIISRQAIISAKKIGSLLAAQWLWVISLGHDDELTRKEAAAAFQALSKKLALDN